MATAEDFLPERINLAALKKAAAGCRACDLYKNATQTVFGEGLVRARLMLVGEQPGDQEDLEGRPFVGPAGRVLDEALAEARIPRETAFVTNVVKHFKWEPQGKRRLHSKPNRTEILSCLPWLRSELDVVKPDVLVCLGATAAQAILGSDFRVTKRRGELVPSDFAPRVMATLHPSSILRQRTSEARRKAFDDFVDDLRIAADLLDETG